MQNIKLWLIKLIAKRELKKIMEDKQMIEGLKHALQTAFLTKTGWVGLGMVVYAGLGFALQHMNQDEAFKLAMEGLGFITGRSAIGKLGK